MADVEFETDNQFNIPMSASVGIVRAENKMVKWLLQKGVARSQMQAQSILLAAAAGALGIGVVGWVLLSPHGTAPVSDASLVRVPAPASSNAAHF